MEKMESFSIEDNNNIINQENKDINDRIHINNSNLNEPLIYTKNKKKKFPIIIFVLIFALLILIGFILTIIIEYIKKEKNYKTENEPFIKPSISNHNYTNLKFDNGLELLLIKVNENDKAGGAIIFDTGYLDNNYEPGFLKLAFISLIDDDIQNPETLNDYLGNCKYSIEEHYSYFSFNILNEGFFPYLEIFSRLTYLNENDSRYDEISNKSQKLYINNNDLNKKENHLLQFLIYGYSNENKDDICPECNNFEINKETKEKIKEIMKSLLNPSKMKIVLNSHYKMSLMKKKFLKYFKNITNKNYKNKEEEPKYNLNSFSPNKMIYMNIREYEINFIKINYFIDPKENDYEQFTINSGYFNYIEYILNENNNQSLYYILTHSENFNIYSLTCEYEPILKSKIKFSIIIRLNYYSYLNLEEIILIVYEYMDKLIEYVDSLKESELKEKDKNERRFELYRIMSKSFNFAEDLSDITPYNYKKGINLFCKKERRYFLRDKWFPEVFNISKLKYYTHQFIRNNSVLILGIDNSTYNQYEKYFNNSSLIQLFKNPGFNDQYKTLYKIEDLDKIFENNVTYLNNTISITNYENKFISKYNDSSELEYNPNDKNNYLNLTSDKISNNSLREFYFKRDTSFHIPKVYMTLYFYHPFMRSQKEPELQFFEVMLYMAYLKREIKFNLADALRAGNTIVMNFNQNLIYISIFAYSDMIYNISKIIKNIAMNEGMFIKNSKFKRNFYIYREIVLEELLNFETLDFNTKIKMAFYENLYNETLNETGVYNFYNFSREDYLNKNIIENKSFYDDMEYIINFVMKGHIYGYLTFEEAKKIYDLYNEIDFNYENIFKDSLKRCGLNKFNISSENFANWMISKNNLTSNKSKPIICKEERHKINRYRFIHWSQFNLENKVTSSIFNILLSDTIKTNYGDKLFESIVFSQGEIYLQIAFKNYDNSFDIKKEFIEYIKKIIMDNKKKYNKKVDVVGDRLYYIIRNNVMDLNSKHEDMTNSAILRLDSNTHNLIYYKSLEKMKNKDYEEFPKIFGDIYETGFYIDLQCIN